MRKSTQFLKKKSIKVLLEQDLIRSNNEFIYTIREKRNKMNIQQILTKNSNQDRYREALERANTFYIIADGKIFQSVNWLFFFSIQNYIQIIE